MKKEITITKNFTFNLSQKDKNDIKNVASTLGEIEEAVDNHGIEDYNLSVEIVNYSGEIKVSMPYNDLLNVINALYFINEGCTLRMVEQIDES